MSVFGFETSLRAPPYFCDCFESPRSAGTSFTRLTVGLFMVLDHNDCFFWLGFRSAGTVFRSWLIVKSEGFWWRFGDFKRFVVTEVALIYVCGRTCTVILRGWCLPPYKVLSGCNVRPTISGDQTLNLVSSFLYSIDWQEFKLEGRLLGCVVWYTGDYFEFCKILLT